MKLALLCCTAVILLGHQGYGQDDLDKLRKNIPGEPGKDYPIYGTSILCKINPQNPGCGGGGGGAAKRNGGNGAKNGGNGGGNRQNGKQQNQSQSHPPAASGGSSAPKNGNGNRRNGGGNNRRNNGAGNKKPGNQNQGGGKRNNGGNQQNEGGDELDALRKNIPGEPGKDYPINGPSILCKINPNNPGCPPGGAAAPRNGRQNSASDYQAAVARGEIPGVPGKDYPVNSVDALRKKGFGNIELAPASLITPDYPGLASLPTSQRKLPPPANRKSGGGNNRRSQGSRPRSSNGGGRKQQQSSNGDSYCPGGTLQACIGFCPSDSDGSEYGKCANDCGKNC